MQYVGIHLSHIFVAQIQLYFHYSLSIPCAPFSPIFARMRWLLLFSRAKRVYRANSILCDRNRFTQLNGIININANSHTSHPTRPCLRLFDRNEMTNCVCMRTVTGPYTESIETNLFVRQRTHSRDTISLEFTVAYLFKLGDSIKLLLIFEQTDGVQFRYTADKYGSMWVQLIGTDQNRWSHCKYFCLKIHWCEIGQCNANHLLRICTNDCIFMADSIDSLDCCWQVFLTFRIKRIIETFFSVPWESGQSN